MPDYNRDRLEITEPAEIAKFYGFKPIMPPTVTKLDFDFVKSFDQSSHPAEKAALMRMYFEEKMMAPAQPVMFYCERPFPGLKELHGHRKNPLKLEASLVSMGSSKSVCECLSIQAGISILNDSSYKDLEVHINSVGDKDSMNDFQKKLTLFVRKNFNSFPLELRQAVKKDLFAILRESKEEWKNWECECPKSIEFLSEPSRLHFKEVLEFLEIMDISYVINHHLVGDADIGSETIFSIRNAADDEELASGFRFNRLAKKIGCKRDLPATVLNISAKLRKKLKKIKPKKAQPQFYLVQFGPEAKLKSFLILKELYKAGAGLIHSMAKDKLGGQISVAENMEIPYILLIGQKEALQNSVVIRHTISRAQEIVPIPDLHSKVKGLI